jgi:hypothetical protein
MKMKKIISLLTTMLFALSFGIAFADEKDMSVKPYNGITYFDTGMASGAEVSGELSKEVYNGITWFDLGPVESSAGGSAAGGLAAEDSGPALHNGITIFDGSDRPDEL